ncbi:hypothetical protein Bca52824_052935 [Brassica carinata]|uniref:Uncharacterized protein n=1 Tax=Brassica carinata TaxID=52824 RepID=A0A8X7UJ68_BRACI|nr:hypothetical protein Bca52824_052935 [Brassica carinata]
MALTVSTGGGGASFRSIDLTDSSRNPFSTSRLHYPSRARLHIVSAAKKPSTQTGRFDSKKRRTLVPTTTKEQPEESNGLYEENPPSQIDISDDDEDRFAISVKDLPGLEPDPFEGPQWDGLGFFVQYLWAFGILFAVSATDFKETPVYKEAMESRDLLDEAEGSNSEDVFESNPTEVAPSLE